MTELKNILISGGTGFIGEHLSKLLRDRNINIKITSRKNHNGIIFDSEKNSFPKEELEGVDTVFHLIGYTHDLSNDKKNKDKYLDINLKLTIEIVNLAHECEVKNFIFLSSTKAIGINNKKLEINEYEQSVPNDMYGKSKREAELYLLKFKKRTNMNISIVRSPLVYGENLKGNLYNLIRWVKNKKFPPLNIKNKRSMIHVSDLCKAMVLISEQKNLNSNLFLVTDNHEYSTTDIINSIKFALNYKKSFFYFPTFLLLILAFCGEIINLVTKFPFDKNRYNKLVNNEYYSSNEIKKLGFKPEFSFYSSINDMLKYIK